jgi:hypothetical protein
LIKAFSTQWGFSFFLNHAEAKASFSKAVESSSSPSGSVVSKQKGKVPFLYLYYLLRIDFFFKRFRMNLGFCFCFELNDIQDKIEADRGRL